MIRFSDWLDRVSTGWVALAITVVFVLFVAFVLPVQPRVGGGSQAAEVGSPDLSFWYSPARLYAMAEAYGPEGRAAYVRQRVTFDVVWPIVYVAFLGVTLSWVAGRMRGDSRFWPRANLLPIAAGALDYLENACTSLVMLRYPAHTPVADLLAPLASALKWTLLAAAFAVLIGGLAVVAWRLLRGSRAPSG